MSFASSSALSLNDRVISVSEPVIDRGSIFVGRAARVSATDEVRRRAPSLRPQQASLTIELNTPRS
jgi:hypothetical protein